MKGREALETAEGQRADGCKGQEQREKARAERLREQQRCRDYWQRRYGAEAERLSRGGVTWLQ